LLLTKAGYWKYEGEWRVIHKQTAHLYCSPGFTAVYFGSKMAPEHQHEIASRLANTTIQLFCMRRSGTEFAMDVEPFDRSAATADSTIRTDLPDRHSTTH